MKKTLAVIICALLVLTLIPVSSFADSSNAPYMDGTKFELDLDKFDYSGAWSRPEEGSEADYIFSCSNFTSGWNTYAGEAEKIEGNALYVKYRFLEGTTDNILIELQYGVNGYRFEYYPGREYVDILLRDNTMVIPSLEGDVPLTDDGIMEFLCVTTTDYVALYVNGSLICGTETWAPEQVDDGFSLRLWDCACNIEVLEIYGTNGTIDPEALFGSEDEETEPEEEETEAQTDAQGNETDAQEQTEAQDDAKTEAETDAETKAAEKSGCKSSVAAASIAMVAAIGCCLLKKKEN